MDLFFKLGIQRIFESIFTEAFYTLNKLVYKGKPVMTVQSEKIVECTSRHAKIYSILLSTCTKEEESSLKEALIEDFNRELVWANEDKNTELLTEQKVLELAESCFEEAGKLAVKEEFVVFLELFAKRLKKASILLQPRSICCDTCAQKFITELKIQDSPPEFLIYRTSSIAKHMFRVVAVSSQVPIVDLVQLLNEKVLNKSKFKITIKQSDFLLIETK